MKLTPTPIRHGPPSRLGCRIAVKWVTNDQGGRITTYFALSALNVGLFSGFNDAIGPVEEGRWMTP